jgi:aspartokinase/homoserine dehydrogenase 1
MKVLKFGGSSVAQPDRIQHIAEILKGYHARGEKFAVVFSAMGGVTDTLIHMARLAERGDQHYTTHFDAFSQRHFHAASALLQEPFLSKVLPELENNHEVLKNLLYGIFLVREVSPRTMDYVLSFGERNAAWLITHVLQQAGLPANYLDARKIIKTDKQFGNAAVDLAATYENIKEYFNQHIDIHVVTGFIASAKGGLTTTLGRGGSDYTAALLGAGLDAESVEIWTDVDGVLTSDPRKVKKAFTIPHLTYAEAMEMSHFGAKVIYPPTIQPTLAKRIPLIIKNTFNPIFPGTVVSNEANHSLQGKPVKGISSIHHIALLTLQGSGLFGVPGIAARLFSALAQAKINIILITQGSSEHSISFAVQPDYAGKAKKIVEEVFENERASGLVEPIKIEDNLSVVAVIGERMRYQPGIAGRLFQALGNNGVNVVAIAQGSSELNISVVLNREDETKALNVLHEAFFLSETTELNLFIVGTGLIGNTLLEQIRRQKAYLQREHAIELRVVGLCNSKKMLLREQGIQIDHWKEDLDHCDFGMNIDEFITRMKRMNLPNTIFVDNTASEEIASRYAAILEGSISISTPNKIATSSSFDQYRMLKTIARQRGVLFQYETNVGAGLPIISTLNDLILSGDNILKIEGVISGSLSYIFNNFVPGKRFSEVVREAQLKGFTEPDPRIDLFGLDMRRKLIILARETGLTLEAEEVRMQSWLPQPCINAYDVATFFKALEKADGYFEQMLEAATGEGRVLRMAAVLEGSEAGIHLITVGSDHPFYHLDGSDNMIVFTTTRYKDRPLVVRGPGAGAEVTAAGIFAEIIKIGNSL